MNPELIPIILILIITTAITCLVKFYQGIWNIHISINKQNEILEEQNKLLREQIELQKFRSPSNS